MRMLLLALLAWLALGACTPAADPVIDTWPVGDPLECGDARYCDELIEVGLEGLDERNPRHAPVVAAGIHHEGALVASLTGRRILTTRSGDCCHVLVVELADGSTRAIGVGYPGLGGKAAAIPWETAIGE